MNSQSWMARSSHVRGADHRAPSHKRLVRQRRTACFERARAWRAGLRWRMPLHLARSRRRAADGLKEREGKIKGAAHTNAESKCSRAFAAARTAPPGVPSSCAASSRDQFDGAGAGGSRPHGEASDQE
jgi:hypothetical protein